MKNRLAMRAAHGTCAIVALGALAIPSLAQATGVTAGTLIQNTATAT